MSDLIDDLASAGAGLIDAAGDFASAEGHVVDAAGDIASAMGHAALGAGDLFDSVYTRQESTVAYAFSQYDKAADLLDDATDRAEDARREFVDAADGITQAGLEIFSPE